MKVTSCQTGQIIHIKVNSCAKYLKTLIMAGSLTEVSLVYIGPPFSGYGGGATTPPSEADGWGWG